MKDDLLSRISLPTAMQLMSRRKRRVAFLATLALVALVVSGVLYLVSREVRYWTTMHVCYWDYLAWKDDGGQMKDRFYRALAQDRDCESMVAGLTYEQIVAKFPSFTDGG